MDVEENSIAGLDVCGTEGDKCFAEKSKIYNDDLTDRTECDCKNDCEMVHIISSLQVIKNKRLKPQNNFNIVVYQ